ncbi:hypothetical protein XELAEV_18025366mg [Xenopus laevis]|uniref:Uncharacterized protein n=1 Tax=Xenopus laevis TaxID=8355 RepID=A0A974HLS2_XENLA|nr:hypothetical protein XELAEV_18025366mg [Xenopus laevis]
MSAVLRVVNVFVPLSISKMLGGMNTSCSNPHSLTPSQPPAHRCNFPSVTRTSFLEAAVPTHQCLLSQATPARFTELKARLGRWEQPYIIFSSDSVLASGYP